MERSARHDMGIPTEHACGASPARLWTSLPRLKLSPSRTTRLQGLLAAQVAWQGVLPVLVDNN